MYNGCLGKEGRLRRVCLYVLEDGFETLDKGSLIDLSKDPREFKKYEYLTKRLFWRGDGEKK